MPPGSVAEEGGATALSGGGAPTDPVSPRSGLSESGWASSGLPCRPWCVCEITFRCCCRKGSQGWRAGSHRRSQEPSAPSHAQLFLPGGRQSVLLGRNLPSAPRNVGVLLSSSQTMHRKKYIYNDILGRAWGDSSGAWGGSSWVKLSTVEKCLKQPGPPRVSTAAVPEAHTHRARVGLFAPVAWPEHGSCSIRGFKISERKKWFQNAGPARYSVLTGFCGRITWGNVRRPEGSRHARHTMLKALRSPARDAVPAALSKPTFPRAFRSQALSPLSALDRASGGAGLQSEPVVVVVGRSRQAGGRGARQPISAAPGPHVYFPCVL